MNQASSGASLEDRKFEADCRFREMELQIKRDEAGARLAAQKDRSPILIPIWVAVVGLVGGVLLTAVQGCFNGQLEKDKAQSNLILKAIETGNVQDSATNLRFLIEAGLLEDPSGKIMALLNKPGDVPKLPASSDSRPTQAILPAFVEASGSDGIEIGCQDPVNPGGAVRMGVDHTQLPAAQGRSRLPTLAPGPHSLWWSASTPSATRICEVVVNGVVRYRDQFSSGNGALLLQVK